MTKTTKSGYILALAQTELARHEPGQNGVEPAKTTFDLQIPAPDGGAEMLISRAPPNAASKRCLNIDFDGDNQVQNDSGAVFNAGS
ncbi:MAG: hypothetical protein WCT24_00610 [Patescibacteria group bacterium]